MSMESDTPVKHSMQQARDILAKWSSSDLLDRISSLPELPAIPSPHFSAAPAPIEQAVDNTDADSTNETISEAELNDKASVNQESDSLETAVEPTSVDLPTPVAETIAEQSESSPTEDSSSPGITDSGDAEPITPQTEDTQAPKLSPARTVETEHIQEHPFKEEHHPEASIDEANSTIAPPGPENNERPEPKSSTTADSEAYSTAATTSESQTKYRGLQQRIECCDKEVSN